MHMPQDASLLWKALYSFFTILKPFFCRLRVEGRAHIPATGGCIIACNHTIGPDYLLLGYASSRQIYYMAKAELFRVHPWFSRFLETAGTFPVNRGRHDLEAFATAQTLLRQGRVLGMFPEGTRSHTGELQRGKTGAIRLAMQVQTPVVPAVVINAQSILKQMGRRPVVIVRFGPPLYPTGDPNHKPTVQAATDETMHAIAQLLPPTQRGSYGQTPITVLEK